MSLLQITGDLHPYRHYRLNRPGLLKVAVFVSFYYLARLGKHTIGVNLESVSDRHVVPTGFKK